MDKTEQATAEIKARIKAKTIAGSYLLYGSENYVTDHYRRQLYSVALSLGDEMDSLRIREGASGAAAQIISALETPSFSSEIKYIEIPGELLLSLPAKDKKALASALEKGGVPPDTCLVVYCGADFELTATSKKDAVLSEILAWKTLIQAEFAKLTESNLIKWAGQIARAKKTAITPDAAKLLCNYCAGDMFRIENELEKLSHLCGGEITAEAVKSSVSKTLELEAFELANAILDANYGAALAAIEKMKQQKEETVNIIGAFVTAFSSMLSVWQLNVDGMTADMISKTTGLHPYRVKIYLSAGSRLGAPFLREALIILARSDVRTKKSRLDSYIIVEQLVSRIRCISTQ